MSDHAHRLALVTGANRGIGRETARRLAATGARVLLAGRDRAAVTAAAQDLRNDGLAADPLVLDVTDPASIRAAAEQVDRAHGRLDVLVNNAGIRTEQYGLSPSQQPPERWRETFDTNLFGVVDVTTAFLPLLRRSPAARIVNVSSLLGSLTTHSDPDSYASTPMFKSLPAYSAAKSAVNSWTVHLAYELRDTPIKVNAVHPGYTRTDLNDGAGDLDVADGATSSVLMALLDADGPTGTYTHQGAPVPW
ncbi:SDR family oxidoreductase [Streptomyces sp. NPDC056361]|uniref:SDR family oxidoreductase n=1 Tax=Streptomyces sp. NPDC056361 TaxID=3345795 RepID=UPI0035DB9649